MRRLLLLLSLLTLSACKPALLPDTSVPDTRENRAVMAFLDRYRSATECRSAKSVMELVSEDFFEGTNATDQKDKYGYAQLQSKLEKTFQQIESLKLSYHVQNIERRNELFYVYYYFVERALVKYPSDAQWVTATDVNRLVIRMKGNSVSDGFEILSGV